jgi:Type II secretion system (T2SS), protein M subtype b
MMLEPGSVLSRTLAVLLLGVALLGAYRLILAPLVGAYSDGEARIEEARALLQRYEALAQQRSMLAERLEEQERAASAVGYLLGPSDGLAAAQLLDRVKSVVEAAGGELRSTQILPAQPFGDDPGFRRTALRVHFVVTIDGLQATLHELEAGQPYLIIDDATIRQEPVRPPHSEPPGPSMLEVNLELFGYLREQPPERRVPPNERSPAVPSIALEASSTVTSQRADSGRALRQEGY